MSDATNFLTSLASELEELLRPLLDAAKEPEELARYITGIGWFASEPTAIGASTLEAAVDSVETAVAVLTDDGLDTNSVTAVATVLEAFATVVSSLDGLRDSVEAGVGGGLGADELEALGADIVNDVLVSYLGRHAPETLVLLRLLTLIEPIEQHAIVVGNLEVRSAREVNRLRLSNLGPLLSGPGDHLAAAFLPASGLADTDAAEEFLWTLFGRLRPLVRLLGGEVYIGLEGASDEVQNDAANAAYRRTATARVPLPVPDSPVRTSVAVTVEVVPAGTAGTLGLTGPALELSPTGLATLTAEVGEWTVELSVEGEAGIVYASQERTSADIGTGIDVALSLTKGADDDPALVVGADDGTRFEIGRLVLSGSASLSGDAPNYGAGFAFESAALVVSAGDGDSFLSSVIAKDLKVELDLGLAWSKSGGIELSGAAGLDVEIPLGLVLFNVFEIQSATLALEAGEDNIDLSAGVAASLDIGPFVAVVDGLGLVITGEFSNAGRGNLGPLDVSIAFRPPDGVGLSIAVEGIASGGGYLYLDHDAGEYSGVLDVDVFGVGVTAIGMLATELPDGSDGWSLFLSLSATFTGLQLGFGFTLNGVGGLIGVHRGLDAEELGDGIRSGAMDSILFPDDPVADAPRILSDLEAIFPTQLDQYVFGPIGKIGWGTPTLIEADVGVVAQLPDPVTITLLGSLSAALPTKQTALLELNIDVAGTIDFTAATLAIDASLRDSRVIELSLSGDVAMRAAFTGAPSFLLSFGGFHPHFAPPADFPDLNRLSVSLETGNIVRIGLWGYFGLTSNTVQFGAGADLWAKVASLTVEGHFDFNALIQFSPFAFMVDLGFSVDVRAGRVDLFGVHLDLMLEGPNPFHVVGSASMKVLGVKTSFRVDETIGGRRSEGPSEVVYAQDLLIEAVKDAAAWREAPADPEAQFVTLANADDGADVLVHPASALEVVQRVVPLKRTLEQFGSAELGDLDRFELLEPKLGDNPASTASDIKDWFAPAQYYSMTDEEKLSAPSFEEMPGGLRIGDTELSTPAADAFELDYEQMLRDPDLEAAERELVALFTPGQRELALAVAHSASSYARRGKTGASSGYSIAPTSWVVTDVATGAVDESLTPATGVSWTEARSAITGADTRTLTPVHELSDAA